MICSKNQIILCCLHQTNIFTSTTCPTLSSKCFVVPLCCQQSSIYKFRSVVVYFCYHTLSSIFFSTLPTSLSLSNFIYCHQTLLLSNSVTTLCCCPTFLVSQFVIPLLSSHQKFGPPGRIHLSPHFVVVVLLFQHSSTAHSVDVSLFHYWF